MSAYLIRTLGSSMVATIRRNNMAKFRDPVSVTCYGQTKVWERKEALEFFLDGAWECDGSESERYMAIFYQLYHGAKEALDEQL